MGDRLDVSRCPTMTDLVLAHDDELSPSERTVVSAHLRQCHACRESYQDIEAFRHALGEVLDACEDDDVTEADQEEAGMHWNGVGPPLGLSAADLSAAAVEGRFSDFLARKHRLKQSQVPQTPVSPLRRWMPQAVTAAVASALVSAVLFFPQQTAVLEAEELLTRVAQYERARPSTLIHRVQLRLTPDRTSARPRGAAGLDAPVSIIRTVAHDVTREAAVTGSLVDASALPASLAELLAAHHYDSRRWLDIEGFLAWRRSLPSKQDRVTPMTDGRLMLHTTTPHGVLREAFLLVHRETYHVLHLGLVFEGIGRVDIEEIGQWVRARPAPAPHTIAPAAVVASAAAVDPAPVSSPATRASVPLPRLSGWRQQTFSGRLSIEQRKTFVPTLERRVSAIRQRLHGLRGLAQRYPESTGGQLSPSASRALRREIDRGYRLVRADLEGFESLLGVLLASRSADESHTRRSRPAPDTPLDWRRQAADGATHADALERQVQQLLTFEYPPDDAAHPASPQSLDRTFSAIWETVHSRQKPASPPK